MSSIMRIASTGQAFAFTRSSAPSASRNRTEASNSATVRPGRGGGMRPTRITFQPERAKASAAAKPVEPAPATRIWVFIACRCSPACSCVMSRPASCLCARMS